MTAWLKDASRTFFSSAEKKRQPIRRPRLSFDTLEDRLTPESRTFGGLVFDAGDNPLATSSVNVRVENSAVNLLQFSQGVTLPASGATFTAKGEVRSVLGGTSTLLLKPRSAGYVMNASTLLSTGVEISNLSTAEKSSFNVFGVPFTTSKIEINDEVTPPVLDLGGSFTFNALGGLTLDAPADYHPRISAPSGTTTIAMTGVTKELNLANDKKFTLRGAEINIKSATLGVISASNAFTFTGAATVKLPGQEEASIKVNMGTANTLTGAGIVVQNGNLTRFNVAIENENAITLKGAKFITKGVRVVYDVATSNTTGSTDTTIEVSGSATLQPKTGTFPGGIGPVTVSLGSEDTPGLKFVNGALAELHAEISTTKIEIKKGTEVVAKLTPPLQKVGTEEKEPDANAPLGVAIDYNKEESTFAFTGGARIQLPKISTDTVIDVSFGSLQEKTSGLVIKDGKVETIDIFVSAKNAKGADKTFKLKGLEITPRTLHFAILSNATTGPEFRISGGAALKFTAAGKPQFIDVTLGNQLTGADGIVIKNGQLEQLNATVSADFEIMRLKVGVKQLTVSYQATTNSFFLDGAISVSTTGSSKNFVNMTARMGDGKNKHGIAIQNGVVTQVYVSLNGSFSLYGLTVVSRNLTADYTNTPNAPGQLTLSGGVSVKFTDKFEFGANIARGGLTIDTITGDVGITDTFTIQGNLALGSFLTADVTVDYTKQGAGYVLDVSANLHVAKRFDLAAKIVIINGSLDTIKVELQGVEIPIGTTGVYITGIRAGIENLTVPENIIVSGGIDVSFKKEVQVFGQKLFEASGNFQISKDFLHLDASVKLVGGKLGEGSGSIDINWTEGKYSLKVDRIGLFDNTFVFSGSIYFDSKGNVTVVAMAAVRVPESIPWIGGFQLGSVNFALQIRPDGNSDNDWAAGWFSVDLGFWKPTLGIQVTFGGGVSLLTSAPAIDPVAGDGGNDASSWFGSAWGNYDYQLDPALFQKVEYFRVVLKSPRFADPTYVAGGNAPDIAGGPGSLKDGILVFTGNGLQVYTLDQLQPGDAADERVLIVDPKTFTLGPSITGKIRFRDRYYYSNIGGSQVPLFDSKLAAAPEMKVDYVRKTPVLLFRTPGVIDQSFGGDYGSAIPSSDGMSVEIRARAHLYDPDNSTISLYYQPDDNPDQKVFIGSYEPDDPAVTALTDFGGNYVGHQVNLTWTGVQDLYSDAFPNRTYRIVAEVTAGHNQKVLSPLTGVIKPRKILPNLTVPKHISVGSVGPSVIPGAINFGTGFGFIRNLAVGTTVKVSIPDGQGGNLRPGAAGSLTKSITLTVGPTTSQQLQLMQFVPDASFTGRTTVNFDITSTTASGSTYTENKTVEFLSPNAPLLITSSVDKALAKEGDTVKFTVEVKNVSGGNGTPGGTIFGNVPLNGVTATNVEVQWALPDGLTFVRSVSRSGGFYNPLTGIWSVGTLSSTATLTIEARVNRGALGGPDLVTAATATCDQLMVFPEWATGSSTVHVYDGTQPQVSAMTLPVAVRDFPVQMLSGSSFIYVPEVYYPAQQLQATGGAGGPYTFFLADGKLPVGMTLSSAGVLSGAARVSGTFKFKVDVVDKYGTSSAAPRELTLTVAENFGNAPQLWTEFPMPNLEFENDPPSTYSVISGSLPPGLQLSPPSGSTGYVIGGTPTQAGAFTFTLRRSYLDADNQTVNEDQVRTFFVNETRLYLGRSDSPFVISSLPIGTTGQAYSVQFSVLKQQTFGVVPAPNLSRYVLESGRLPPGLTLSETGAITGTPTASGTFTFRVSGYDPANGVARRVSDERAITILAGAVSLASTPSLPGASVGNPYSFRITPQFGTGTFIVTRNSGTLPPGLTLASDGTLSGTPTTEGTFNFGVIATSGASAAGVQYTLKVLPTLEITNGTLDLLAVGSSLSQSLAARGGSGSGYTYRVATGQLPDGMNLSTAGVISGTPTLAGQFPFTVEVKDSLGATAQANLALFVSSFPIVLTGFTYARPIYPDTSNITRWTSFGDEDDSNENATLIQGDLPPGLTVADGILQGIPTTPGFYTFIVQERVLGLLDGYYGYNYITQRYSIQVATPIVAVPDRFSIVAGQRTALGVLGNDLYQEGDVPTILSVSASSGTVVNEGTRIVFTPGSMQTGTVTLTYVVRSQNGTRSTGTVTIDIIKPLTVPTAITTFRNQPVTFGDRASTLIFVNEGLFTSSITVRLSTLKLNGAFQLKPGRSLPTGVTMEGNNTSTFELTGKSADVNVALRSISFVPAKDKVFKRKTFTVTVRSSTGKTTFTGTVQIDVNGRAPVYNGNPIQFQITANRTTNISAAQGILSFFYSPDNVPLKASRVVGGRTGAQFSLLKIAPDGSIVVKPKAGTQGQLKIKARVTDGLLNGKDVEITFNVLG